MSSQLIFDLQRFAHTAFNIATGNTVLSSSAVPVSVNQVTGTLPVNKGGTGATVLSAVTVGSATSANSATTATTATTAGSLTTARALQVSLNKTSSTNFQGNANVTNIGVQGTLAIGNGGTGITSNPSMLTNLSTTAAANVFQASPRPGVTGTLPVANGGTGQTSLADVTGVGSALRVSRGTLTGTNADNLMHVQMADNDYFRIRVGGTATNAGWVEFATADDSNEPIYVRQYQGNFTTITRTATLLDGSGNTSFPGTVTAAAFSGTFTGNVSSAVTASSLATARALQVSLSNTAAANFQGNTDVTNIGVQGILPVANGGTGTNSLANITVGKANTLTTARALQVSLSNTNAPTFNGTADVKTIGVQGILGTVNGGTGAAVNPSMLVNLASTTAANVFAASPRPGVTGTLPIANGGTGATVLSAVTVGKASSLATARALQVSLSSTAAANFQGTADVKTIGVQGILPVANGGTGQTVLSAVAVGAATKATQDGSGNTITTTYAPLALPATQNAAHNIPYAGNSNQTSATIHSFQSLKSGFYTETLSSSVPETSSSKSWYNVISVRHRNGGTDGTQYGMLVFSRMNQEGNLYWQQQVGGSWQNSKKIIDSSNIGSQTVASAGTCTGNANTASSLATARALQVSLSNTSAANFQGNGDVKTIGVQGTLAVGNGGTGTNNLANITVGKANTLTTARALQVSLSTSNAPTFNGTADVKNIGVTGTLGVANGGTGQTSVANIQAGKDGNGSVISSTYLKLVGGTITGDVTLGTSAAPAHIVMPTVGAGIFSEYKDVRSGLTIIHKMDYGHDVLLQGSNKAIIVAGECIQTMCDSNGNLSWLPAQGTKQSITANHNFEDVYIMADKDVFLCAGQDSNVGGGYTGRLQANTGYLRGLNAIEGHLIDLYGTIYTAAGTGEKSVTLDGMRQDDNGSARFPYGMRIAVEFRYGNTASPVTLNVNNMGAKGIMYKGSNTGFTNFKSCVIYEFIYNLGNWYLIGDHG